MKLTNLIHLAKLANLNHCTNPMSIVQDSWRRLHPKWEFRLWTDADNRYQILAAALRSCL